jgi:hypothetical protein
MFGYHISVFRQRNGGASPAIEGSPEGARLAVWQTSLCGRDWIKDLVKAGKAIKIADNNGYPLLYTAPAKYLVPTIISAEGPPRANPVWLCGAGDILTDKWAGGTVVDRAIALSCRPDEWLIVEAWDES